MSIVGWSGLVRLDQLASFIPRSYFRRTLISIDDRRCTGRGSLSFSSSTNVIREAILLQFNPESSRNDDIGPLGNQGTKDYRSRSHRLVTTRSQATDKSDRYNSRPQFRRWLRRRLAIRKPRVRRDIGVSTDGATTWTTATNVAESRGRLSSITL